VCNLSERTPSEIDTSETRTVCSDEKENVSLSFTTPKVSFLSLLSNKERREEQRKARSFGDILCGKDERAVLNRKKNDFRLQIGRIRV
jgi:hypothetical protein